MILWYNDRIIQGVFIFLIVTIALLILRKVLKKKCKVKFFLKSELFMIVLTVILGLFGYFGKIVDVKTANTKMYSKSALMKDINQLEYVLLKENPLYYTDSNALKAEFEKARKQIKEEMTEEEFYRLVNPIVVKVQCGHTNLSISSALEKNRKENAKFLPIDLYAKDDCLYEKDTKERVVSINGNTAAEIINTLLKNISHDGDNLSGAYYIMNHYFATKYYDFVEQPKTFDITYQKEDGNIYTKTYIAEYDEKDNVNAWNLRMAMYDGIQYYSSDFQGETAILKINVFMQGKQSFSKFLKEFFHQVEEKQCKKIIIDVRGNFGGDPRMAKELLSYFITEPFDYFQSNVSLMEKIVGYDKKVIPKADKIPYESELWIDGACFSTCGHFASIYQSLGLGTILGEATGGGSICTDESKDIVLYQTGLRLHYSTKVFEVNADCEHTNVVFPDYNGTLE